MKALGYNVGTFLPAVLCKLFGDNSRGLKLVRAPTMRLRTKHTNGKYHHLRAYVANSTISVLPTNSYNQPVDMLLNPLHEDAFIRHKGSIMGW